MTDRSEFFRTIKLALFILFCILIGTPAAAQEFILGENSVEMRLIREYNADSDSLVITSNDDPVEPAVVSRSMSPVDDVSTVRIDFTIPMNADFLGFMELQMFSTAAETLQSIASPLQRQVIAPKPVIDSLTHAANIYDESNVLHWNHRASTISVEIYGHRFFPPTRQFIEFNDPYLEASSIRTDSNRIEFNLDINQGANPGMKELRLENYGGASDTLTFNLYSEAKPDLRGVSMSQRPVVFTGVARRVSIPMIAPQNVEEIYLARDSQGEDRVENALITIEPNGDPEAQRLDLRMVILDRSQGNYDLFIITKNVDAEPYRLARLNEIVQIRDKDIKFEPVRKYVGDYLSELMFASGSVANINDLAENTGYTLRSPSNQAHRVTFERSKGALVFDNPVRLDVNDQGNWRLDNREDKYVAYVGVRKIPTIVDMQWSHQDQMLRQMFDNEPYATRTRQTYTVTINIQDLPGNTFPVNSIDFFGGNAQIVSSPTKKPTRGGYEQFVFDLEVSETVEPNFEYPIVFTPINRLIGRVTFKEFNQPIAKTEDPNLLELEVMDSNFRVYEANDYQTFVGFRKNLNTVLLTLNQSAAIKGPQFLRVEATLLSDEGEQKGKIFTGSLRTDKPRLTIQFPRQRRAGFEEIRPWDSIYLQVHHDFEKYSPEPTEDIQSDMSTEYTWEHEFVFQGPDRLKRRIDLVAPWQHSAYVFDGDSVRVSLFNIGVNMLWYTRTEQDYRQYKPISWGFSFYTSQLEKLANSEALTFGGAGLLNFDIAGKMELALGIGATMEYQFNDTPEGTDQGIGIFPSLVIQMRLPVRYY